jgi:hypothetical protein
VAVSWRAVAVAVCACSGSHAVDDRSAPTPHRDPPVANTGDARGSAMPAAPTPTGDVQVRVEWHDVPLVARASPGKRTHRASRIATCGPLAPSVAPTATWGIPDAIVLVDGARSEAVPRVVIDDCTIAPRVVAAAASVTIASAVVRPVELRLSRERATAHLDVEARADPVVVALPIAGHEVTAPLDAGALYELLGDDDESAWIVADASALVTDATGVAVARGVPVGEHSIVAFVPPRGGQPARLGRATVRVAANSLVEISVELKAP